MRFIPSIPTQSSSNTRKTASGHFKNAAKDGASASDTYQSILKDKMAQVTQDAMKGGSYGYSMIGGKAGQQREMSATAKAVLQKIAEKKAKAEEKKKKKDAKRLELKAHYLSGMQGGRVDDKGNVFDAAGKVVLRIDAKTGKIKNNMGNTVGTYNANSTYSEYQLQQLVAKYDSRMQRSFLHGTQGHNAPAGNVFGGVWGGSTDGFWGGGSDNNGGGGFWG